MGAVVNGGEEAYCLKWSDFHTSLTSSFLELRAESNEPTYIFFKIYIRLEREATATNQRFEIGIFLFQNKKHCA